MLWLALFVSWVALLPLLWSAVTTVPSPERLEQSRMVAIPSLQTLVFTVLRSAGELMFVLVLAWPRWRRAYAARLLAAAVALIVWFIATTPLGMSRLQWTHRRWLALLIVLLLLAAVINAVVGLRRRTRPKATDTGG